MNYNDHSDHSVKMSTFHMVRLGLTRQREAPKRNDQSLNGYIGASSSTQLKRRALQATVLAQRRHEKNAHVD